jgi:4'-phosphopantetheinyl transferase
VAVNWPSPHAGTSSSLVPGCIHLWRVDLDAPDAATVATFGDDLSLDERQRAARFRSPEHARRWTVSRVALRRILADYLHGEASDVVFELGPKDKPALAASSGQDLKFNLSHSAAVALVAVSAGPAVGVDVEWIRDDLDVMALARRALPAQAVAELASASPRSRTSAFFRLWVRHEASVKCLGTGLGDQSTADDAADLVVEDVVIEGDYAAALAVAVTDHGRRADGWDRDRVRRWEWDPG